MLSKMSLKFKFYIFLVTLIVFNIRDIKGIPILELTAERLPTVEKTPIVEVPKVTSPKILEINEKLYENFDIHFQIFMNSINIIKQYVINLKNKTEDKMNNFQIKIDTDLLTFKHLINTVLSNCLENDCLNSCKQYIPDKIYFKARYKIVAEFLLFEFNKELLLLDREIDYLNIKINSFLEGLYFNKTNTFLRDRNKEISIWKEQELNKLFEYRNKIWKISYGLMEKILSLEENEKELENKLMNVILEKLHDFICCTKQFELGPSIIVCDQTGTSLQEESEDVEELVGVEDVDDDGKEFVK